eukprot:CAMPEP_0195287924 /NCGR_PEP_ID=MMETSP0707-20130614/4790_1 /TAXON_ID=33640 /ORGANISM="Asterionellopsis glacialis, Strain CCMP134" /LENGTH=387 /DNA_ID=CAMNT_0040347729 /DNA_START=157 /DNA_END=1320 /DNA_ORIENTATION=-
MQRLGFTWRVVFQVFTVALHASRLGSNTVFALSTQAGECESINNEAKSLVSAEVLNKIAYGGVAVIPNWLPPSLTKSLHDDAQNLFDKGYFTPDGLTNTALKKDEQGFTGAADRQTFRGGDGWDDREAGDSAARVEFATLMRNLRKELALGLDRPTLDPEGVRKHEMTYNWYEPGASLGRHLDEHHEETKGTKGWMVPTRRSVTWLVYLNDGWSESEGGSLRCYPRRPNMMSSTQVGSHDGNLQIGWIDGNQPVFLDSMRESGLSALYSLDGDGVQRKELSSQDFDVPRQPIDFSVFLRSNISCESFEQISTARLDPRFASAGHPAPSSSIATAEDHYHMDVLPAAGTLVLFDSVSLPHLVREVTAKRQRIAATGWFHEDSQFQALV